MNYLILGGGGFQGIHLCNRLLREGAYVRVLDHTAINKDNVCDAAKHLDWMVGDYSDPGIIAAALSGIDVVFHLASTTTPKSSNDDPAYDVISNVVPTLNFMDKARENGVKKIIFFSSGGTVYGEAINLPIPEDHPTHPICAHGIHKLAIEEYLHLYYTLYGLDYAVMRIANPYGEFQRHDKGQGVVAVLLHKMLHGEPVEIWGDGSVVRDYIYVGDVIEAALKLAGYRGNHKVFNIGSGQGRSLNELISGISSILNLEPVVRHASARQMDVPANVLDISRAKSELGWEPSIKLEDWIHSVACHARSV